MLVGLAADAVGAEIGALAHDRLGLGFWVSIEPRNDPKCRFMRAVLKRMLKAALEINRVDSNSPRRGVLQRIMAHVRHHRHRRKTARRGPPGREPQAAGIPRL